MKGRWLGLGVALVLGVIGYAWWLNLTRGARALGRASAMVTISEKNPTCAVKRSEGKLSDKVSCDQVAVYLRDKLNLSPGAFVGIAVLGKVAPDAVAGVSNELTADGFKVAGVIRVGYITEPGGGAR